MAYAVPKDYTWELKIASYDAGRDRRLRPSNQLKLQQEVGELHLGIGGLDYDAFYQHGMVFVLTRTRTVIHRAPLLDEHVKLRTWHRDSQGAQFFRCYQFLDSGERPLIESVSPLPWWTVKPIKFCGPPPLTGSAWIARPAALTAVPIR